MGPKLQYAARMCLAVTAVSMSSCSSVSPTSEAESGIPWVEVKDVPVVHFRGANSKSPQEPGETDCNSPAHWDNGTLYLFNSAGHPWRSAGADIFRMTNDYRRIEYNDKANGGRWIECTWKARDGQLFGWYHFEPAGICPGSHPEGPKMQLTAPKIGAARSLDNGATWENLGVVLEAPPTLICGTSNYYFAGGNGDFSAMLDDREAFLYLFISTYVGNEANQGVAVARMPWKDRNAPVGKFLKWQLGKWSEPGIGGASTPIFAARKNWHAPDADAFWGPSIHWNSHLRRYVMLLNRAVDSRWRQEGVYVSFSSNLDRPRNWTQPTKILESAGPDRWYPQVIGLDSSKEETDKLASRRARLFLRGESRWELIFHHPADK